VLIRNSNDLSEAELRALLVPRERKDGVPHQPLGVELDGVPITQNALHNVGREEAHAQPRLKWERVTPASAAISSSVFPRLLSMTA